MSKFNQPQPTIAGSVRIVRSHPDATKNFEGGLAFTMDAKTRLYAKACTSLVGEDKFYQSGTDHDVQVIVDIQAVVKEDPGWALRLASYVRNEMNLRSMPIMLLVETARLAKGSRGIRQLVETWTPRIVSRADELKETLAYALQYGRPVPICLRRGLAAAFHNFDEYQCLKYDSWRKGGEVAMIDVLRMCHPKPATKSQEALWGYLCEREVDADLLPLTTAQNEFNKVTKWGPKAIKLMEKGHLTWESAVSKFGNKAEVWDALDLPMFAALRNLRNMMQSGANLKPVLEKLDDAGVVRRSKILPFRYYSALKVLDDMNEPLKTRDVMQAVSKAMEHSIDSIPELPGKTAVFVDVSGSMTHRISGRSELDCMTIACLFGAAVARRMDALVVSFANSYTFVDVSRDSLLTGMRTIMEATDHTATYPQKPLQQMLKEKHFVDRIVLLSDMQCYTERVAWQGGAGFAAVFDAYKKTVNKNVKLISIDLQGYGTQMLPNDDPNVALLAGWSEKLFRFIAEFDRGHGDAVKMIEEYEPRERRPIEWKNEGPVMKPKKKKKTKKNVKKK